MSEPALLPCCPTAQLPNCLNCGQPLADRCPRLCPACGQAARLRSPTLMAFAQQFGGAYLATEGAQWRTLKRLLLEPGELTRQYLAGRQARRTAAAAVPDDQRDFPAADVRGHQQGCRRV